MAVQGGDQALQAAHEELRRLMREYQRVGGQESGGVRALELLMRIREQGARIRDLERAERARREA